MLVFDDIFENVCIYDSKLKNIHYTSIYSKNF